ncbi:hypothetical protein NQ317_000434 [Molorchus minor]|uniref:Zinc finger protein-like 1 homolog n=1 Tax=Molorchus minor TaxID=1323400 RepID=A0ABQ9ITN6_9CUCU|nr:hypothetical protein NQ317_000434 [Molorchus minor]
MLSCLSLVLLRSFFFFQDSYLQPQLLEGFLSFLQEPTFPPPNLVSPVADVLKEKLAGVNWARAGLGLPLLSEEREVKAIVNHAATSTPRMTPSPSHSVVNVDDQGAFNRTDSYQGSSNRRVFQDIRDIKTVGFDHDDDKYKRKSILELVGNWWKIGALSRAKRGKSIYRKYCMLVTLIVIGVTLLLYLMSKLGRYSTENDPSLDMGSNQFVNVHDNI